MFQNTTSEKNSSNRNQIFGKFTSGRKINLKKSKPKNS